MLGVLFIIVAFLVALEFGVHIIYHWKTGKAGLYDPPFAYLKDIFKKYKGEHIIEHGVNSNE